jgi:hypothetical protein
MELTFIPTETLGYCEKCHSDMKTIYDEVNDDWAIICHQCGYIIHHIERIYIDVELIKDSKRKDN